MNAERLATALKNVIESLSEHDDEGMLEHAEQIVEARQALAAHAVEHATQKPSPECWRKAMNEYADLPLTVRLVMARNGIDWIEQRAIELQEAKL